MRYRALDVNGDYTLGQGSANFLVNSHEAVGQLILTRLKLFTGEWFLDTTEGTPYYQNILGKGTQGSYDLAIQARVLDTQGVAAIVSYTSILNTTTRSLSVELTVDTIYGLTTISGVLA